MTHTKIALLSVLFLSFSSSFCKKQYVEVRYKNGHRELTTNDEQAITSLMDILKTQIKSPDNMTRENVITAGVTMLIGLVIYFGADKVLELPVAGPILKSITTSFVEPKDLIQGLSLMIGISGFLRMYTNSTERIKKLWAAFGTVFWSKQVTYPNQVTPNEVRTCVWQTIAVTQVLSASQDFFVPAIKNLRRAMHSLTSEEVQIAERYNY